MPLLVAGGILLGSAAGAIAGGLYFWADEFFVWLFRGVPDVSLEPIEDADADVLLSWITGPKLCRRWSGGQLTWPLDRQQLLERFATARGELPARRIFKAVDVRTGNMVGYVELRGIDCILRRVSVELALVDPCASRARTAFGTALAGHCRICLQKVGSGFNHGQHRGRPAGNPPMLRGSLGAFL